MDTRLRAEIRECLRATLSDYVRSVFAVRLYTDMEASVPRNDSKPFFVKKSNRMCGERPQCRDIQLKR